MPAVESQPRPAAIAASLVGFITWVANLMSVSAANPLIVIFALLPGT
jgi:hypothetical protein